MTDLQKAEFEMLREYIRVCEKLELTYYLVCGSALGAVKYRGFIPWDDDIDVAMPRKDYDLFLKKAQKLLPEHIFVQTNVTDPEYPLIFAKLRNSQTTFIEKQVSKIRMNHGVYIDVFPLDGYPAERSEQLRFEKKKQSLKHKINCVFERELDLPHAVINRLRCLCGYKKHTAEYVEQLIELISSNDLEASDLWCNFGNWQGKREYAPRSQYGEGVEAEFEGLIVRVPEKYDEYLTQKYGDWRSDLPESEKQGHHHCTVIDLNKPYSCYV